MTSNSRLLNSSITDPFFNLAMEESILLCYNNSSLPTLRLWQNVDSVILGVFQNPTLEINLDLCIKNNINVVKRFTGGGAVFHDLGNLNWSLFIPKHHYSINKLLNNNLSSAFKFLCKAILEFFQSIGLDSAFSYPNSILVNNKKISGMAGAIKHYGILCHGTLLINTKLNILNQVLTPLNPNSQLKTNKRFIRSKKVETTNLNNELQKPIDLNIVKNGLIAQFANLLNTTFVPGDISNQEMKLGKTLLQTKYNTKMSIHKS